MCDRQWNKTKRKTYYCCGQASYSSYTAEDTGSAIKGKRIDVYYASHRKATAHGVKYQKIKVYI